MLSQIEMPYEELRQEMTNELDKHGLMVLATTDGKSITARTVYCISNGLTIYCGTKKNSRKYKQILVNPNVALADGRLQIEGVASLRGHPLDEENLIYIETFKEKFPDRYESQSKRGNFQNPNMRVIEIDPRRIAYYIQGETAPESYLAILEPSNKKAYKLTRDKDQF